MSFLEPEYDPDKFAETVRKVHEWSNNTEKMMGLTDEHLAFMEKHNITVSTAYIGMVRIYKGNNQTIFQTSVSDVITKALGSGDITDYDDLSRQVREYFDMMIAASPEDQERFLEISVPLFAHGELDEIRMILESRS